MSIGEHLTAIKRQANQYTQEVHALRFFGPEEGTRLACKVLIIVEWAVEYNELSAHPLPEIPEMLELLYHGSRQVHGQFPQRPPLAESGVTDVRAQSQVLWFYFCTLLQHWEDKVAIVEDRLFGG